MKFTKSNALIKTSVFVFASLFAMTSCQDDELTEVTKDVQTQATAADETPAVGSLTIEGTHTVFVGKVDCSTCTYVVVGKEETVDGKELGLKPGSVICLDAAKKYGNLTFTNVEGSEKAPITIGTCAK